MSTNKITKNLVVLLLTLISFNFNSCRNAPKEEASDDALLSDSLQSLSIDYLLPAPSEVIYTIIGKEILYSSGLTAELGIENKSQLVYQQALLLGVYITDFSYNVMYNELRSSTSYLNSIQVLCNKLGLGSLFYDAYFKRAELNLNNIDSLDAIFSDFSQNSFSTLSNSGNNELLSLIAMGSSVEAMYIGYKTIDPKSIDESVLPFLVGQKALFDNYYNNFLQYNKEKPGLDKLIGDLGVIYNFFDKEMVININSKSTKTKDSHFDIKDKTTLSIDDNSLKTIGNYITTARENIILLKYQ